MLLLMLLSILMSLFPHPWYHPSYCWLYPPSYPIKWKTHIPHYFPFYPYEVVPHSFSMSEVGLANCYQYKAFWQILVNMSTHSSCMLIGLISLKQFCSNLHLRGTLYYSIQPPLTPPTLSTSNGVRLGRCWTQPRQSVVPQRPQHGTGGSSSFRKKATGIGIWCLKLCINKGIYIMGTVYHEYKTNSRFSQPAITGEIICYNCKIQPTKMALNQAK